MQCHQYLLCEPLLHLGPLREKADNPIDFREPNNFSLRYISDLRGTVDRHEVVLTGTDQRDVINTDHLFQIHFILDHGNRGKLTVIKTRKDFIDIHLSDTMWRFSKAVVC